jgi:hypothetical protein
VFRSIANIYKDAMPVHGVTRPVSVILAEDETKMKSRVS